MAQKHFDFTAISLFTPRGERKYLNACERERFLTALPSLHNPYEQSFCEMLFWSGCRPTEARALTPINIDLDESMVIIRSLKNGASRKISIFALCRCRQILFTALNRFTASEQNSKAYKVRTPHYGRSAEQRAGKLSAM